MTAVMLTRPNRCSSPCLLRPRQTSCVQACRRLGAGAGILSWPPKTHNVRALFVLRRVQCILDAISAAFGGGGSVTAAVPGVLRPLLDEMVAVVDDVMISYG